LEEFGSGSFIDEFVSVGPKNYAFSVICPSTGKSTTKCKVKGITLNYENSKVVKLTSLKNMILEDAPPVCSQCQKYQKEIWWHSSVRAGD